MKFIKFSSMPNYQSLATLNEVIPIELYGRFQVAYFQKPYIIIVYLMIIHVGNHFLLNLNIRLNKRDRGIN